MKKFLSFCLAFVLLFALLSSACAFERIPSGIVLIFDTSAPGCSHTRLQKTGETRTEYVALSAACHAVDQVRRAVCLNCGWETALVVSSDVAAHTWMANGEHHSAEENTHTYEQICSLCRLETSYTTICAAPQTHRTPPEAE